MGDRGYENKIKYLAYVTNYNKELKGDTQTMGNNDGIVMLVGTELIRMENVRLFMGNESTIVLIN